MRNPGGYLCVSFDDGRTVERDSATCNHCNKITFLRPRQDPTDLGGHCRICDRFICSNCVGGVCKTLAQQHDEIEKALARRAARQAYG